MRCRSLIKEIWDIDFGNLLFHLTLICLATDTLPLYEFFRSWNSIIIKRKKKSPPHPPHTTNTIWSCFLYWKLFSLNSCKISRKLSITKSNRCDVAGATLLKLVSAGDILLPILQELGNNFLKEHFKKTDEATCICFNVLTLYSSSHQRCYVKIAFLKNSAVFTGKYLCWSYFWICYRHEGQKWDSTTGVFL